MQYALLNQNCNCLQLIVIVNQQIKRKWWDWEKSERNLSLSMLEDVFFFTFCEIFSEKLFLSTVKLSERSPEDISNFEDLTLLWLNFGKWNFIKSPSAQHLSVVYHTNTCLCAYKSHKLWNKCTINKWKICQIILMRLIPNLPKNSHFPIYYHSLFTFCMLTLNYC